MKLCETVVHMDNYNFTNFHQNQMKNKNFFINSLFFCSEFLNVSRIMKSVHSVRIPLMTNYCKSHLSVENRGFFQIRLKLYIFFKKMSTNHIAYNVLRRLYSQWAINEKNVCKVVAQLPHAS